MFPSTKSEHLTLSTFVFDHLLIYYINIKLKPCFYFGNHTVLLNSHLFIVWLLLCYSWAVIQSAAMFSSVGLGQLFSCRAKWFPFSPLYFLSSLITWREVKMFHLFKQMWKNVVNYCFLMFHLKMQNMIYTVRLNWFPHFAIWSFVAWQEESEELLILTSASL